MEQRSLAGGAWETGVSTGATVSARPLVAAAAVVGLAAVICGFRAWLAHPSVGLYHDDAIYVMLARALREGYGYRLLNLPFAPFELKYPPLYPLLLAAVWPLDPVFPGNAGLLHAVNPALLFVALLLGYHFCRRTAGASPTGAFVYVFLLATNPLVFSYAGLILSDTLFLTLILAALTLATGGDWTRTRVATLAALAAAACLTRTVGIALVAAVVVHLVLRQKLRALLAFIGLTGLLITPWMIWSARHDVHEVSPLLSYYVAYAGDSLAYRQLLTAPARAGEILWANTRYLVEVVDGSLWLPVWPPLRAVIYPLLALGLYRSLAGGLQLFHLFVAAYTLVVVGWPWHPGRFVTPLMPIVLVFLLTGVEALWATARRHRAWWRRGAAGLGWVAVLTIVLFHALWLGFFAWGRGSQDVRILERAIDTRWPGVEETIAWIERHTDREDVLASGLDTMYSLYTGRRAVRPWFYRPDSYFYPYGRSAPDLGEVDAVRIELGRLGVRYLVVDVMPGFTEDATAPEFLHHLLESYSTRPPLVFSSADSRHWIYRLP